MLTVLMPVKNHHPPFLEKALDSLRDQTCSEWVLRIIVDASDLPYFTELLAPRLNDPRIALLVNEGRKLAGKYNTGMRRADTEFVAALLSDDLWSLDAVEVLTREIRENPDVDFFHSSRRFIDADGEPLSTVYPARENVTLEDFRTANPVKHLLCWRRSLALSFGGMDESLNSVGPDDMDFPWLMAEHGARFKAVHECLYIYRDHREAFRLTTHLPLSVHRSEHRRILEKHGLDEASIELRLSRAEDTFLRQCLYRSKVDKFVKDLVGHDARKGWREPYRWASSAGASARAPSFTPFVSVVVPVYNGEATIEMCVRSLLDQDYPADRFELIVVDNESTDGTARVLARYGDRVKLLREGRRGAAAARNRGVREARGDVVAFTDADCFGDPGWLRAVVAPLEDQAVGIAGGRILSKRPCNRVELFGEAIHDQEKAIDLYEPPYVITMNWASRRPVLEEVGLFDDQFLRSQDVELAYRIFQRGYRFVFTPEAIVYHRNERTLAGLFREGLQHGFHSLRVVAKHRTFLRERGFRPFKMKAYGRIARSLRDYVTRANPDHALCSGVFNTGKEVGKLAGFLRFL